MAAAREDAASMIQRRWHKHRILRLLFEPAPTREQATPAPPALQHPTAHQPPKVSPVAPETPRGGRGPAPRRILITADTPLAATTRPQNLKTETAPTGFAPHTPATPRSARGPRPVPGGSEPTALATVSSLMTKLPIQPTQKAAPFSVNQHSSTFSVPMPPKTPRPPQQDANSSLTGGSGFRRHGPTSPKKSQQPATTTAMELDLGISSLLSAAPAPAAAPPTNAASEIARPSPNTPRLLPELKAAPDTSMESITRSVNMVCMATNIIDRM
jgi:hypothetical protein